MSGVAVCWALKGVRDDRFWFNQPIHEQVAEGRTACGIVTDGSWDASFHEDADAGVTCKRCIKVRSAAGGE